MKLGALTGGGEEASVTGLAIDHRKVAPGTIFGAFAGVALVSVAVVLLIHPRANADGEPELADEA